MKRNIRTSYPRKRRNRLGERGGVLVESLFGTVLLLMLVGGSMWAHSLSAARIRALVADRFTAWNRGIENRGYRETLDDNSEKEFVQQSVFGADDDFGHGTVANVFYGWLIFSKEEKEGIGPPPRHWTDEHWALHHAKENAEDAWIGQNIAAVGVTIRTPASVIAFLHDGLQYGFNRMQKDLPATFTIGGRTGGLEVEEGKGLQVSACVTMRTGAERQALNANDNYGDNAGSIRDMLGNYFAVKTSD